MKFIAIRKSAENFFFFILIKLIDFVKLHNYNIYLIFNFHFFF